MGRTICIPDTWAVTYSNKLDIIHMQVTSLDACKRPTQLKHMAPQICSKRSMAQVYFWEKNGPKVKQGLAYSETQAAGAIVGGRQAEVTKLLYCWQ